MVRIAGIDRDFSPLELMFHQAEEEEKLQLAAGYIAQLAAEYGELTLDIELESNSKIHISAVETPTNNKGGSDE
jgi:hypothetical protein